MDILLGYADLIRLFNVDDPRDFEPGLELRGNGVFVKSRDGQPAITRGGEEEAVLTEHPTGNLSEPVLELPCNIESLESFMEAYGLVGVIPVSSTEKVLKPKIWAQALADAKDTGQHNGSILVKLSSVLEKYRRWHEAEVNEGKKVVLREVLDDLRDALADVHMPNLPSKTDGKMDERHRLTLLRIIRALCAMASLPERGATTAVDEQLQTLGFTSPKEAAIRSVLNAASGLEPE